MKSAEKQEQFNAAMELFSSRRFYKAFGAWVSTANILLQLYLLCRVAHLSIGMLRHFFAVAFAYLVTDFVNGLVHMYMDQNDDYESFFGPLIANFHLHHKHPQYKKNPLPIVYFNETGSKVWLVGYLLMVALLVKTAAITPFLQLTLVYIGILSSVAEVSHYLCHSSNSSVAAWLARYGLLLSKRHHAKHHLQDNVHYAFLNGFTDPLLNAIASRYSRGYKHHTDLHYAAYAGIDLEKRTVEGLGATQN